MNQHGVPFVFFGIVLVLMAALVVFSIRYARKRTRDLAAVAQQIGFNFVGKNWQAPVLPSDHKTTLLQRTRGSFSNAMTGSSGKSQVALFDYTYPVGKSTVTQTLACFFQDAELPAFELRPEGILDRIGDAFVHDDIDFDSHPEFSKRFLLRSPDEANTRKLFTLSLLTYVEQMPPEKKWHVEVAARTLIVYRGGSWVSPAEFPSFLNEASAIAAAIVSGAGSKTTWA